MRIATLQVFDEIIGGTGPWYSRSEHDQQIGQADFFAIQAVTTGVGGTPTLTVQAEHSPDGENWLPVTPPVGTNPSVPEIPGTGFQEDGNLVGSQVANVSTPNVRLKITMGGTSPKCRLILYTTLRARAAGFGR